jgi:uncharacterized protein
MSRREEVLAKLRAEMPNLREKYSVDSLALFGSVARGEDDPESDVDVLVDFDPEARPTLLTLYGLGAYLEELLGCEVDIGTTRSLKPRVRERILAERLLVA